MLKKIGRNDPCWCGSGKKYKDCHLALDEKINSYKLKGWKIPPKKIIKRPDQIDGIRESGLVNIAVLDYVAENIHAGMSTEDIDRLVAEGLSIEGSREDIDFIARIIRQEITAVYHVDEIKAIADHDTDRLAKMLMKIGKINGAIFFLLIKVLMNLANEGSEDDFDQMLSEAVKLGVDYMQKKDFQINSFLQDTSNLRELAEKL